jgi:hypothetical protein
VTTPTTVNVRLQLRADTAANWTAANPTLLANEVGLETDTKKLKVGNGSTAWNSLAYFPSIVSGGTVLGNLEIGSTGTLTFEGSTADGFETTLAVTNPTADRTITLPDQSGTVVVTGNASIVDADIAANAEIAVSKLANGTANQVIVTDGTNVSWSDNLTLAGDLTVNGTTTTVNSETLLVKDKNIEMGVVDTPTDSTADGGGITLKGATDKTINWIDATDAWTSSERFSVPLGSAASPSLTFTGDENTGIYSPGADQVAVATNGTGRLFVDASGRVLINGATARTNILTTYTVGFQLEGTSFDTSNMVSIRNSSDNGSANLILGKTRGSTVGSTTIVQSGDQLGVIRFTGSDGTTFLSGSTIQSHADGTVGAGVMPGYLAFLTTPTGAGGPSERLRITSAGLVGIGTSTPGSQLDIVAQDNIRGTGFQPFWTLRDSNDSNKGIRLQTAGGAGLFYTDSVGDGTWVERVRVTAGGNVGIGTTSPTSTLTSNGTVHITGAGTPASGAGLEIGYGSAAASTTSLISYNRTGSAWLDADYRSLTHQFFTSGSERARIDSSGRLLVGTSSTIGGTGSIKFEVANGNSLTSSFAANAFANSYQFIKSRSSSELGTIVQNGDEVGNVDWFGDDGTSTPKQVARIQVFVDGTPGANDMPGRLVFSTTSDGASSPTERMRITSDAKVLFACTGDPSSTIKGGAYIANTASPYFSSSAGTSTSTYTHFYFINGNGTVGSISTNGSATAYNTSSDYRLKENVTTVTDGITRLQQLRPSRFNFIADPDTVVDGFLAHEVQTIVPEAITGEKDAVDDDGNPVYQGIDQSKLVPLLTAALQEAIAKIETLEGMVAVNNITIDEQQHQLSTLAARLTALESA